MQIIASILAEMFGSGELIDQSKYADIAPDAAVDAAPRRHPPGRGRGDRPRLAARAAGRGHPPAGREPAGRAATRLERAIGELRETLDQMLATSDLGRRRAARGAGGLPHVRPRHGLAAADPRGDRHRPVGRGRGAPGPGGDPGPDRPRQRPLPARAADRPRRHRQPPAAPPGRQGAEPRSGAACPTTPSWSRAIWVLPTCSSTTVASCAASILEEGSKTAHVTIVARAIGIPMVGRIEGAMCGARSGQPGGARRRQRPRLRPPERRGAAGLPSRHAARVPSAAATSTRSAACRR